MSGVNIGSVLVWANNELNNNSLSAKLDVDILLCKVLSCQTTYLHAWPEETLTVEQQQEFETLIARRKAGEPIAYLTEKRGFWTLDLAVTEATLIPRPDTETLVECVLDKLSAQNVILDLGTGSGAIACALADMRRDISVFAMDFSMAALQVAKQNSQTQNVGLWRGSWSQALADNAIDIIVSNPPYIAADDPHLQQGDLKFEPQSALVSGVDGLDDLRQIVSDAPRCLKSGGWLMVEHGYDQAKAVSALFSDAGFSGVEGVKDMAGQDRVTYGQYNG